MAKGGMSGLKARQGNNVINENIKSEEGSNVVEVKKHRLVIDVEEDLYWKFKTMSGMRKQKMTESMAQALKAWIESA